MARQLMMIAAVSPAVVACVGECPSEQASLLQVRSRGRSLVGAYARAAEAIRTATEDADDICTKAETGDVAPVAGLFEMDGDDAFEVQAGYTAPKPGVFCVSKETMALVERAHGFESRTAMEATLTKKEGGSNPWGADGVFAGKYEKPTNCSEVPLECKLSVYPVRHEVCTILWTLQNPWLKQFPGCGEDATARRNIEGACYRDSRLRLTCPLTCEDTINFAKTMNPDLQQSYVCWAGGCDNNVTSNGVNEYIKQTVVDNMPKALQFLKPENDVYPCHSQATLDMCKEHCPSTCQMVLDTAVAAGTGTAQELCAASCGGAHAETAESWNNEMVTSLSAVQDVLSMTAEMTGPCDAAAVETVCSSHCVTG